MPEETIHPFNQDGLHLKAIHLGNFRNYDVFDYRNIGDLTIFTGPNAVGKTSIIEAIQLMTSLQSFRSTQTAQMVKWSEISSIVETHIVGDGRDLDLKLSIEDGHRRYELNGKKKSIQQLKGLLPAVIFTPDDLHLVKGSSSARRGSIDDLGSQLSKNFFSVKNDYAKLIKQKNQALKDAAEKAYIESINEVLLRVGAQLLAHRMVILGKVDPLLRYFYSAITGSNERVGIVYQPSWLSESEDGIWLYEKQRCLDEYRKSLEENFNQERIRQRAIIGPHTDSIWFTIDARNAVHYASQGQQRSIVLAYKLAELAIIQDMLDQRPILLLDDVMSELDENRRNAFMTFISDDIQTFITTTNVDYFNSAIKEKACLVQLPANKIEGRG